MIIFVRLVLVIEYLPEEAEVKHVDEMLKLMQVMTGDRRFENVRNTAPKEKGERQMVKSFLEIAENKGIAKGRAEALIEVLPRLIATGMTSDEALNLILYVHVKLYMGM